MDPDRPCPHDNFATTVVINRIGQDDPGNHTGQPTHYMADIQVRCTDCGEPFRWMGVPAGVSTREPTSSLDQRELRAPLCPDSSPLAMGSVGAVLRGPYEI